MKCFELRRALGALRDRVPRKQIAKHLTVSLLLINVVICLAAFSFGFSVYGTIQAMDRELTPSPEPPPRSAPLTRWPECKHIAKYGAHDRCLHQIEQPLTVRIQSS